MRRNGYFPHFFLPYFLQVVLTRSSAGGLARTTPASEMTLPSQLPKARLWQCEGEYMKTALTEHYLVALTKIKISVHGSCTASLKALSTTTKPWFTSTTCALTWKCSVPMAHLLCMGLLFSVLFHFSPFQKPKTHTVSDQNGSRSPLRNGSQLSWMKQQICSREKQ